MEKEEKVGRWKRGNAKEVRRVGVGEERESLISDGGCTEIYSACSTAKKANSSSEMEWLKTTSYNTSKCWTQATTDPLQEWFLLGCRHTIRPSSVIENGT